MRIRHLLPCAGIVAWLATWPAPSSMGGPPRSNLEGTLRLYLSDGGRSESSSELLLNLRARPELTLLFSDRSLLYVAPELRWDSDDIADDIAWDPVAGEAPGRLGLVEAYYEATSADLRLRAGTMIADWSVTDTISPSDNLNGRDWTDPLEGERLASPGLILRSGGDSYTELAVLAFRPSLLPAARWAPVLPPGRQLDAADVEAGGEPQFAARRCWTRAGLEAGGSLFVGRNYAPSWQPEPDAQAGVRLVPKYRRLESAGVFAAADLPAGWIVRSDLAFLRVADDDDYAQAVCALERTWQAPFMVQGRLTFLAEYVAEVEAQDETPAELTQLDFRRAWSDTINVSVRYEFDDDARCAVGVDGSYDTADRGRLLKPSIAYAHDDLTIRVGGIALAGPDSSYFGSFSEDSRCFMEAVRNW